MLSHGLNLCFYDWNKPFFSIMCHSWGFGFKVGGKRHESRKILDFIVIETWRKKSSYIFLDEEDRQWSCWGGGGNTTLVWSF